MKYLFILCVVLSLLFVSCRTVPVAPGPAPPPAMCPQSLPPEHLPSKIKPALTLEEFRSSYGVFANLTESQKNSLVQSVINSMSIEEKIGQLFMLSLRRTDEGKAILEMDNYVRTYMDSYKPGGIILFRVNFKSPQQTKTFIQGLQKSSRIPLFISTDEEGGAISRLGEVPGMGVTPLPSAWELGEKADPVFVKTKAAALARDMTQLGFNMNMAPVADVRRPGPGDVIGVRSFSSDPLTAALITASVVREFEKNGISAVLKHFPGHGNVTGDSHTGPVQSLSSQEEFRKIDFIPFMHGIKAGADFVMVGHIAAPALTGSSIPASLLYEIQTRILREQLDFKGLIISDSMDMKAISMEYTAGEAAVQAFLAGTDIILMPHTIPSAQAALLKAVTEGTISSRRLEHSLTRILRLKFEKGLFDTARQSEDE